MMGLQIANCALRIDCGTAWQRVSAHLRLPQHLSVRSQRGQSIVELALLLPLFLIVILGIIEVGRLWWTQQALTNAAREGVRYSSQTLKSCPPDRTQGKDAFDVQKARDEIRSNLSAAGLSEDASVALIEILPEPLEADHPTQVKVKITYYFDSLLPFLPSLISGSSTSDGTPALVAETVAGCEP
jgi:Flp pilus assembly protein TadG